MASAERLERQSQRGSKELLNTVHLEVLFSVMCALNLYNEDHWCLDSNKKSGLGPQMGA
jgi:hypothetical protein